MNTVSLNITELYIRDFVNNLLDLDRNKLFLFYINQVVINVTVPYILLKLITVLIYSSSVAQTILLQTRQRITHQFRQV